MMTSTIATDAITDHPKGMTAMTATITPKDLATALGSDARTTRKFLRDSTPREDHPGKGGRWEIDGTKRSITAFRKSFAKWQAEQAAKAAARAEQAAKDAAATAELADADDTETDEDPTDEVNDSE